MAIWCHLTLKRRVPAILTKGLLPEQRPVISNNLQIARWRQLYGCLPVFISEHPWFWGNDLADLQRGGPANWELLGVEIAGLKLLPDIGVLIDLTGYGQRGQDYLQLDSDDPGLLAPWANANARISYSRLLTDPDLKRAAIAWSGAAAIVTPIPPSALSVLPRARLMSGW